MNLTRLFDLSFIGRRDAVALEFEGRSLTFGEIDERSNRLAQLFRARGLERGDRLCVYLANSVELIDTYLASGRAHRRSRGAFRRTSRIAPRRRRARRHHLHVRNHRRLEGCRSHPPQLRGQCP